MFLQLQNQWKIGVSHESGVCQSSISVCKAVLSLCFSLSSVFFPEAVISSVWKEKVSSVTLTWGIHLLMDKLSRRWGSRTRWDCVWIQWWVTHFPGVLQIFSGEKTPIKLNNYSKTTKVVTSVIRNLCHTFFQGLLSTLWQTVTFKYYYYFVCSSDQIHMNELAVHGFQNLKISEGFLSTENPQCPTFLALLAAIILLQLLP